MRQSKLILMLATGLLLGSFTTKLAAQSIEEFTEVDDLAAIMKANMALCRGFEADLASIAVQNDFPKYYATLSPGKETLPIGDFSSPIGSIYKDVFITFKNDPASFEATSVYARMDGIVKRDAKVSDQEIWALVRLHYYLTFFQSLSTENEIQFISSSIDLIRLLKRNSETELRDRAIFHIIANIAAFDVDGEYSETFQKELFEFAKERRSFFNRTMAQMNRKIARFAAANPVGVNDFYESSEYKIGFYKTEVENDLILLFHLQSSFRYLFTGRHSSENAGMPSVTVSVSNNVTQMAAICSSNLLRANVRLLHHRFPAIGGSKSATSLTEKFVFDYFDLGEKFNTSNWFGKE